MSRKIPVRRSWRANDFWRLNYYTYLYKPLTKSIIAGLRFDGKQTFGEAPFYMLPFIEMRGVPSVRYQDKVTLLTEGGNEV